jgi:molybdenum cofactor cytidylyltransferase
MKPRRQSSRRSIFPALQRAQAATGRVNLHAQAAGLFTVDAALVDAINAVDPAITIATLANRAAVERDQMVATVKIIPLCGSRPAAERRACAGEGPPSILRVDAFRAPFQSV